jgi:hypothetical protein
MGRGAAWIAAIALAFAVPALADTSPPTAWDGTNPFSCELQSAGFGTEVPHPDADPYCVEFDKRRQNVTQLGIVDFLSKEPARVAAASDKCFYFQVDHWRASVVQDDGTTKLYEWDGHYFFDKARGDGGAWVTNFNINGQPADPDFRTGGVISHDDIAADPSCAAKAAKGGVYAGHKQAPPEPPPPLAPCAEARGAVTSRSIGPLALGMTDQRARALLGEPRRARGHTLAWCTLRATFRRGRIAALRTSSPIYSLHGVRVGGPVRWRSGTHRIGRNIAIGVRGHRVRWLACARAS